MKIVRILLYEGPEEELEKHMNQVMLNPGTSRSVQNHCTVKEIFRGVQQDPTFEEFIERKEG